MLLRFPDVPLPKPHYESVYCTLTHPTEARALWIRTTVQKRPGASATGALWVTWFGDAGVRAAKLNDLPVAPGGQGIECGPATQGPTGSQGELSLDGLGARWDLRFTPRTGPLEHLRPAALYRAPVPRTKATSPVPDLEVSGALIVDEEQVDLSGWTGMLGHNWGTQHAEQWIWLRVPGLGEDGLGWLDAVLGRVRVGPVLAPWTAFGAVEVDGTRHHLGGLLDRRTSVAIHPDGAAIDLAGKAIEVSVRATLSPPTTVGWEYSDPAGHRHEVVNSSVATMSATISRGSRRVTYEPARRGVLEIGGEARAVDVPLQPYPD
jgi:hypothetical protein